ncbi:MAG: glycosyltransferase family 1 protein [Bacteroidia bacterium]|jgi:glycosyltransferase involved in cell wall biosynthesis|nr:glycosyltransferase family 1 protein [Bacteroidia bacterium]
MYKIGFDAKRAFKNFSGLGNYSRSTISSLTKLFNYNEYYLYTPEYRKHPLHKFAEASNITIRKPENFLERKLPWLWRSYSLKSQLNNETLDLWHGLSGELPLCPVNAAQVVTIHDLIFLRYPKFYKPLDRFFYRKKAEHAVKNANKIIAISKQTADDIVAFFGTDRSKIEVVYQSCDPQFYTKATEEQKEAAIKKYNLPKRFIVAMGTVEERKNVANVVKALPKLPGDVKLFCFGKWTPYAMHVNMLAEKLGVKDRVIMVHDADFSLIPAVYSLAECMVYVSLFEGFGIPVLEGITYGIPVVTSGGSSMLEAGGDSAIYVNPDSPSDIADKIEMVLSSPTLKHSMIERGYAHAKDFRNDKVAERVFAVYQKAIDNYKKENKI